MRWSEGEARAGKTETTFSTRTWLCMCTVRITAGYDNTVANLAAYRCFLVWCNLWPDAPFAASLAVCRTFPLSMYSTATADSFTRPPMALRQLPGSNDTSTHNCIAPLLPRRLGVSWFPCDELRAQSSPWLGNAARNRADENAP